MRRLVRAACTIGVLAVLVTGSMPQAHAGGVSCVSSGVGAGSINCNANGVAVHQDCPGSPCTDVVKTESEIGSRVMQGLGANGVCKVDPRPKGGSEETDCTAFDTGDNPAARITIKVSWSCCPSDWNVEIIFGSSAA